MQKSENNLLAWLAQRFADPASTGRPSSDRPAADDPTAGDAPPADAAPSPIIPIGDDMAMIAPGPEGLLIAADMIMDGVDFDADLHTPEQIGRKALAVNLSDCAAMAVRPRYALVSIALPNAWAMEQARRLFMGIEELARKHNVAVIGGDTNSWDKPLVVDVTILAEPWPGVAPIRRSGMKPGDLILVTGELGGSLAGHHLTFEPRVAEARWLAEHLGEGLHAMMDLSDGLSTDAERMCRASGIGIELAEAAVHGVASHAARKAAATDGRSLLDHALNDGEDFELLFAVDPEKWATLADSPEGRERISPHVSPQYRVVGRAVAESGLWLIKDDNTRKAVESRGGEHFK